MNIKLNGEVLALPSSVLSVSELVSWKCLIDSKGIAVAINECVVLKDNWATQVICENDSVLIIEATQGG
jgi:sulfur carrier protein